MAAQELKEKYGIDVRPESPEETEVDELTENQLSFFVVIAPSVIRQVA